MANPEFVGLRAPTNERPRATPLLLGPLIKDALRLQTLFVIGALAQVVLFISLPHQLAIVPAIFLAFHAAITTVWQISNHPRHSFTKDVFSGRTTAQLPGPSTGRFSSEVAAQSLVVFHFGVRFNHPLGSYGPGGHETIRRFKEMAASMSNDEGTERYGMLGMTKYRGCDRETNNTLLLVFYFRDVEGLQLFAQDPLHRDGWEWLAKSGHAHISAFHETFVVDRGAYESVYLDCPPLLMGDLVVRCPKGEDGGAEWVGTLVDAKQPVMNGRTMSRRKDETVVDEMPNSFGY